MGFEKFFKKVYWLFYSSKLIEDLPDAVIFVDTSGYVLRANKKANTCFNIVYDEKKSIHIDSLIDNGLNYINSSIESNTPVVSTVNISGENIPVELNAIKRWDYFCVVVRDNSKITRDITTCAKISMLNKEKNEMISKLKNEFTSPLTSINGFSKGLLDGIGGQLTEKQEKYVKIINSNSIDLYNFILKFIEFSYSESSLCNIEGQKFDVIEVIKTIMKDFDHLVKEKNINFTLDYGILERRTIFSDQNALKSALENIIDVSISNTESGFIEVKLELPNEEDFINFRLKENTSYLKITVTDSGKGFESFELKSLCDPYAQLSKGKKEIMRSFKLGAASIFIKRLDGYINISSDPLAGSVYNIVIPTEKRS